LKVKEHISDLIPLDVADKIMRLFSYEKYSVMKAIMIDLAKNENFEDYKAYINDPVSLKWKYLPGMCQSIDTHQHLPFLHIL
jgi:hypothetical protein